MMLTVYEIYRPKPPTARESDLRYSYSKQAYEEARTEWYEGLRFYDKAYRLYDDEYFRRQQEYLDKSISFDEFRKWSFWHLREVAGSYAFPSRERIEELYYLLRVARAKEIVDFYRNKELDSVDEGYVEQAKAIVANYDVHQAMATDVFAGPEQAMLVDGLLAAGLLGVIGGGDKGQKTNVMFDLAVSAASGTPALGYFKVPKPLHVVVFSGETRGQSRGKLCLRIAFGKKLSKGQMDLVRANLRVVETVPQIGTQSGLQALTNTIRELQEIDFQPDIIVLDPAYMALGVEVDMTRINTVGSVVLEADQLVRSFGATLVLCWHYSKQAQYRLAEEREPAQLGDLTGAGASSAARQWLLLSYFEPYDAITGRSKLWLNAGIATTQSRTYMIDIDEGVFCSAVHDGVDGRQWLVSVKSGSQAIEHANKSKQAARQAKQQQGMDALKTAICEFLSTREPLGAVTEDIREAVGSKNKVGPALAELLTTLQVVRSRQEGDHPNAKRWRRTATLTPNADQEIRLRAGEPVEVVFPGLAYKPPAK
jgi:RecA-family ATPase